MFNITNLFTWGLPIYNDYTRMTSQQLLTSLSTLRDTICKMAHVACTHKATCDRLGGFHHIRKVKGVKRASYIPDVLWWTRVPRVWSFNTFCGNQSASLKLHIATAGHNSLKAASQTSTRICVRQRRLPIEAPSTF